MGVRPFDFRGRGRHRSVDLKYWSDALELTSDAPALPLHLPPTGVSACPLHWGRPAFSARSRAIRKGREPASLPPTVPTQQLWDLQRPKDLLCSPAQSLAHWCGAWKESLREERVRCGGSGAQQGGSGAVSALMPWAQDPASPGKTASQQELPSFKSGSFFFPFSSTSARALSLSFFSLLSLPSLSPSSQV